MKFLIATLFALLIETQAVNLGYINLDVLSTTFPPNHIIKFCIENSSVVLSLPIQNGEIFQCASTCTALYNTTAHWQTICSSSENRELISHEAMINVEAYGKVFVPRPRFERAYFTGGLILPLAQLLSRRDNQKTVPLKLVNVANNQTESIEIKVNWTPVDAN